MKLWYPKVLSEDETLEEALRGRNLARYGDGELRLMLGGTSASQKADKRLAWELAQVLAREDSRILPCIPNARSATPKASNWEKYTITRVTRCYRPETMYGSSFVTRPDSAPWIDREDYWGKVRSLWVGKDVTLVKGSDRSLTPELMPEAKSIRVVEGRYRDSYQVIDQLMDEIGKPSGVVILCLGATATVLAARLARLGVHALDLGHLGMMLKHKGTGRWDPKIHATDQASEVA